MADNSRSKLRGDAAVATVMAALLEQNWIVLEPRSDATAYDLLVDISGKFQRLQVRRAWQAPSGMTVNLRKTSMRASGCHVARYDASQIDFLVGVNKHDCYVFPVKEVMKRKSVIIIDNKDTFKNNWSLLRNNK